MDNDIINIPSTAHYETENDNSWRLSIIAEWNARQSAEKMNGSSLFPLAMNPFGAEEILAMVDVLLSGRLTLGAQVENVEKKFSEILSVPYAIMVNSGSSANLLAVAAVANKIRRLHCVPGDQVLVPAVCWSTSVFPLIQHGLKPVFVDVDPCTFNVTLSELENKMTSRVKAVMAVHVLGNSINMQELMIFIKKYNLILIEDTCESLGTYAMDSVGHKKMLGTFGDFGTFSFYFSHHITSGEGGMVVCHTEDDYNLIRCLRAHGWTRHLTNREDVENRHLDFDSRFLFVNLGYNLRPLEVQAAMLSVQLDKLNKFNEYRRDNLRRIKESMLKNKKILEFMSIMEASDGVDPAWFGLALLLHRVYGHQRSQFLAYLTKKGIENRPIISGNFTRQPCISIFCDKDDPKSYTGAEAIHWRGLFIGIHQIPLEDELIHQLISVMENFPFKSYETILVTNSDTILGQHILDVVRSDCTAEDKEKPYLESTSIKIKTEDAEWIFLSSTNIDLSQEKDIRNIFRIYLPTQVINCSPFLENIEDMLTRSMDCCLKRFREMVNILEVTRDFQRWNGKIKLFSILSTTNFSKNYNMLRSSYTSDETQHFIQPNQVFTSSLMLELSNWYRECFKCDFVCILAGSIFSILPNEKRIIKTPMNDIILQLLDGSISTTNQKLNFRCSIKSLSNIISAYDLARILIWITKNHKGHQAIHVVSQTISSQQIIKTAIQELGFSFDFENDFNDEPVERLENIGEILEFHKINEDFKMTQIKDSIRQMISHFKNYNKSEQN